MYSLVSYFKTFYTPLEINSSLFVRDYQIAPSVLNQRNACHQLQFIPTTRTLIDMSAVRHGI